MVSFPSPTPRLPVRAEAQAQLEGLVQPSETCREDEPRWVGKGPECQGTPEKCRWSAVEPELGGEGPFPPDRRSQSWRGATGVIWDRLRMTIPGSEQGFRPESVSQIEFQAQPLWVIKSLGHKSPFPIHKMEKAVLMS